MEATHNVKAAHGLGFCFVFILGKEMTTSVSTEEINHSIEKVNDKVCTLVPKIVPSQVSCPVYGLETFMLLLPIYFL